MWGVCVCVSLPMGLAVGSWAEFLGHGMRFLMESLGPNQPFSVSYAVSCLALLPGILAYGSFSLSGGLGIRQD